MDNQRLIFFIIFSFSIILLWDAWQKDNQSSHNPKIQPSQGVASTTSEPTPTPTISNSLSETAASITSEISNDVITISTDTYRGKIAVSGGDIVSLDLIKHGDAENKDKPLSLFTNAAKKLYIVQSGLIGAGLPTHKTKFTAEQTEYRLGENDTQLVVPLIWKDEGGISVEKRLKFSRDSYLVEIEEVIRNESSNTLTAHAYYQFLRNGSAPEGDPQFVSTYTGPAIYTGQNKFQKIEFSDIEKGKEKYPKQGKDGWLAMLQHYFFAAWLPAEGSPREFFTKKVGEYFAAGIIVPIGNIAPNSTQATKMVLYAGPQDQEKISKLAPGLDLVVDYGMLTVIATPLFWLVAIIYKFVQNWGIAIILLTVLIKLAFYPLSAKSYRSMAAMRVLSPKLQKLKEQYGDDRERLHHAMMDLYKTEKINPLGGCLPVLIQMPVFIALYWVLLYSVEMRQAPFAGWVQDLSSPDPYYVLPILMGITMIIQTKLNPTPPDPIQAKVMMMMPIFFSVFFFFFPAGLVLYWLVNNIISIAQQWYITRSIEAAKLSKA